MKRKSKNLITLLNYSSLLFKTSRNSSFRYFSSSFPVVQLKKDKEHLIYEGNLLLYSGSIENIKSLNIQSGQECLITDSKNICIGRGFFNSTSLYSIRIIATILDSQISLINSSLEDILKMKFQNAFNLRKCFLSFPNNETNIFRFIHGEGDGLSGLIVDIMNHYIVIQSCSYWVEVHRKVIEKQLKDVLCSVIPSMKIIWTIAKNRLISDGWKENENEKSSKDSKEMIVVKENNICYHVSPGYGQKTGFYCDQRDNRLLIRNISRDCNVLDLYSGSGGFSLNALIGGAKSVTLVESSSTAIQTIRNNLQSNHFPIPEVDDDISSFSSSESISSSVVKIFHEDVEKFLQLSLSNSSSSNLKQYDLIICDPPKFAPSIKSLHKAKTKYVKINQQAMSLVRSGGLLLSCSCSQPVSQQYGLFLSFILEAAKNIQRNIRIVKELSVSCDHPINVSSQDGKYFTAYLLQLD